MRHRVSNTIINAEFLSFYSPFALVFTRITRARMMTPLINNPAHAHVKIKQSMPQFSRSSTVSTAIHIDNAATQSAVVSPALENTFTFVVR